MLASQIRVGDIERLAAAERLAAHTAAGRLTLAEHDQRVTAAWAARTHADLDALLGDLPTAVAPTPWSSLRATAATTLAVVVVATILIGWLLAAARPGLVATTMAGCT